MSRFLGRYAVGGACGEAYCAEWVQRSAINPVGSLYACANTSLSLIVRLSVFSIVLIMSNTSFSEHNPVFKSIFRTVCRCRTCMLRVLANHMAFSSSVAKIAERLIQTAMDSSSPLPKAGLLPSIPMLLILHRLLE